MRICPLALLLGVASCKPADRPAAAAPPAPASPEYQPAKYAAEPGALPKVLELGGPRADLTPERLERFEKGRRAFLAVFDPATGLGPYFEETSCASCHDTPVVGGEGPKGRLVFMSSVPGGDVPHYPPHAMPGHPPRSPPPDARVRRPRALFGLGLLEEVPDEVIVGGCDAEDKNKDGVRGKAHVYQGRLGRFGHKGHEYTVRDFAGNALFDDLSVTNNTHAAVSRDADALSDPEVPDAFVDALGDYVRGLAPPPRGGSHPSGEARFASVGCVACHRPDTSEKARGAYTDMCLHDMGPDLSDGISDKAATASDWRTPPLWGLRFQKSFLHDGRAHTPDHAIRLHGGEAAGARARYLLLSSEDRAALLAFLGTL